MTVGDIDGLEILARNGPRDPSCKLLSLSAGGGCIDEDGFVLPCDQSERRGVRMIDR